MHVLKVLMALAVIGCFVVGEDMKDGEEHDAANRHQAFLDFTDSAFNVINQQVAVFMDSLEAHQRAERRRLSLLQIGLVLILLFDKIHKISR